MTGLNTVRRLLCLMVLVAGQVLAGPGVAAPAIAADRPDPNVGPGGPVLVVPGGTFGSYLFEIMRGEGLNLFTVGTTSTLTSGLSSYKTVVLGAASLTTDQVTALTTWVNGGGNLIAMGPDSKLAGLLGLTAASGTVSDGYLKVDTGTAAGAGIYGETMQFHGSADRYTANSGTQTIATLYSSATTSTGNPAVTLRSVGSSGGSAAAFTYDLAQSVVLTRQGNPAWAGSERDGTEPIRSDDLFYPDYVDLSKVAVPQADEQQRLLANLIIQNTGDTVPVPRFWYLPRMEKAAVVMTADNHNPDYNHAAGVQTRFDYEVSQSSANCSVDNWGCVRSTSYFYPGNDSLTAAQASTYQSQGFELAVHVTTTANGEICKDVTQDQYATQLNAQLDAFAAKYTALAAPVTNRNHCIAWVGYTGVPEEEVKQGIHLDTNYYYWPGSWLGNRPGMFTGSGFPQRFSTSGGTLLDIYQATTQMTDESGQTYPYTAEALLDGALDDGYYGTFVANIHTDGSTEQDNHDIIAAAKDRQVPVISAKQLLTWIDGRNASSFTNLSMSGSTLSFDITAGSGSNGLYAMLPMQGPSGTLQGLTRSGSAVTHTVVTIKGIQYWAFATSGGSYAATYGSDTTAPTFAGGSPASNATSVAVGTTVSATFSESVASASASAVTLRASGAGSDVAVTRSVNGSTVTLTPSSALAPNTTYTVSVSTALTDLAGNHLASATSWSFTTGNATFVVGTPTISDTTPVVGQTLSMDKGSWSPSPDSSTTQWLRDGSTVVGTADTYTVTSDDLNHTLVVKVTGTKTGYTTATGTSAATSAVQAGTLTAGTPTITGNPGIGASLSVDLGTWGPTPVSYTYRWLRGSTVVSTSSSYTVVSADVGSTLTVEVTGSKTGYTSATRTSGPTAVIQKYPFTTAGTPTITGDAVVGKVLTADEGTWNPTPTSFTYTWTRGGVSVGTARTYTLTSDDLGSQLSVTVTGKKADYTDVTRTSALSAVVAAASLTAGTPTISGSAVIGGVLTADPGTWGPAPVSISYQWLRGASAISGATARTYTVTSADVGSSLSVRVTGTKTGYAAASVTSGSTASVPSVPSTPTPASPNPTISGVPRVGMPLTASLGTWTPTPTRVTYQWYRLKSSGARVAIAKATKAGYTPSASVQGKRLVVRVKAYSGSTLIATRYSAPSAKVGSPMAGRTPKISDRTPAVGQVLTATPGSWKPAQTTFTYQWYARNGKGKVTKIAGATGSTYQVAAAYSGYRLKVKVTGSAPTYKPVTRTSKYTHKVR